MILTIFAIIILFLAVMEAAIPYLVKRTVVFGVSIPEEYTKTPELRVYKKRYALIVFSVSMVVFISFLSWGMLASPAEEQLVLVCTAMPIAMILLSLTCYVYFHAKTTLLKRQRRWGENLKQIKVTDLSVRSQDEMLPWYMYVLPVIVTLGVMGYTVLQYPTLPEQIPTHWGPNGQPDAFTTKNPLSVISAPLILLVMQVMFLGINETTKRSGIKLSATSTESSRIRQLTLRKYTSWFLFLISLLLTTLFSFLQLSTIHEGLLGEGTMLIAPFIFLLVIFGGAIVYAVKVGRAGEKIGTQSVEGIGDVDEDEFWKGGLFYFNKNDPSIFVEKRFGVGWTLNLANPKGYFIVLGPLAFILLFTYFI